ncbi:MAG: metallophosphoesterase family protein [Candidatus Tectimicrobiota bacterium]
MRVAILSDIHGNLEALEAVLAYVAGQAVDRLVCLGDLVGYGADPNPCCERIREVTIEVVAGNHDHAAVGLTDVTQFNPFARQAAEWTARVLARDHRHYLERLPFTLTLAEEGATLVHATPRGPEAWAYLFDPVEALPEFGAFTTQWCFIGHTHCPVVFVRTPNGGVMGVPADRLRGQDGYRYIVNVGSVGQPRDGDPRAAYAVYDHATGTLELHRVAYDIEAAQDKIRTAGLPPVLAERLSHGR